MEEGRAKKLLSAERERVERLLRDSIEAGRESRDSVQDTGDIADSAQPFTDQEGDDAVTCSLRDRLSAIRRAEDRLRAGTYGRSVKSDTPIPDDRLEADPAAELTVEEVEEEAAER
ncbi:MAG TPA: hypothetical protein VEJ87_14895 [Acidimicrobiales bacterium]|nr:hypothetical protein [Acidimicrobiales bacterium]